MNQKLKDLYNNHKLAFYLLLPLTALFLFHSLIMDLLLSSANKLYKQTAKQDDALQQQVNSANTQAAVLKTQADDLQHAEDLRKESDISDDWNKTEK